MRPSFVFVLAALAVPAWGQVERATLARPHTHAVLEGSQLEGLLNTECERIRVYAFRGAGLEPIPFQIDERTPDGVYAYEQGDERRSDTDDGRFDQNDELVFRAADAGDRVRLDQLQLGQSAEIELALQAPEGGQAWVYVLSFDDPPPRSETRYVSLDWEAGELIGWTTDRVQLHRSTKHQALLAFNRLRFRDKQGDLGPDVLDQAKFQLRASYLFTDIVRRFDEVRSAPLAWTSGPVRALVRFNMEVYLIWGHWVKPPSTSGAGPRAGSCELKAYGDRVEINLDLKLPVDLEADAPSNLRTSLDFAPQAGTVWVWSDKNRQRLRAGATRRQHWKQLDTSFPAWVCASTDSGSVLAQLRLSERLRRSSHQLFLRDDAEPDPPEDTPGSLGNLGFTVDLRALPAGTYSGEVVLQFGEPLLPGTEGTLLRPDTPLTCKASAAQ
ncbi:MAG: hypothetical protein R3F62_13950 [Planctomycetota bacterium]